MLGTPHTTLDLDLSLHPRPHCFWQPSIKLSIFASHMRLDNDVWASAVRTELPIPWSTIPRYWQVIQQSSLPFHTLYYAFHDCPRCCRFLTMVRGLDMMMEVELPSVRPASRLDVVLAPDLDFAAPIANAERATTLGRRRAVQTAWTIHGNTIIARGRVALNGSGTSSNALTTTNSSGDKAD
jgi:hypothetical protein